MEKLRIMVADDNANGRRFLSQAVAQENDMELVSAASNGVQVLEQLHQKPVDVLIMDMVMPQLDGFGVLEALRAGGGETMPKVIMTSSIGSDEVVDRAIRLGARYYAMKPYDIPVLIRRIRELGGMQEPVLPSEPAAIQGKNLDEKISAMFLTIGIPAHIKGYQFLREAVKQVIAQPEMINRITKELYPTIAHRFDTSSSKVERAIRHAIEVAWNRGRIERINQIFGHCVYTPNDKPTNGEFIALIADHLSLERR